MSLVICYLINSVPQLRSEMGIDTYWLVCIVLYMSFNRKSSIASLVTTNDGGAPSYRGTIRDYPPQLQTLGPQALVANSLLLTRLLNGKPTSLPP